MLLFLFDIRVKESLVSIQFEPNSLFCLFTSIHSIQFILTPVDLFAKKAENKPGEREREIGKVGKQRLKREHEHNLEIPSKLALLPSANM